MYFSVIIPLFLTIASFIHALSLFDALRTSAGASHFADLVQGNTDVSIIDLSGIKTVFAPSDECFHATNVTHLKERQTLPSNPQHSSENQVTKLTCTLNNLCNGAVIPTNGSETVVSGPGPEHSNMTIRALITPGSRNSVSLHPRIFSGLGNYVSVIRGDIPYDGGLIQVTDGFFTLPQPLFTTATQTGNTAFANAVDTANLTSNLEAKKNITVFIPSNAAFLSSNSSNRPDLSYHVLSGFVGYLPLLVDGASLRTRAGTNITVRVSGDETFINDARIVHANLVLKNGVAHVLDKVLKPPSNIPALLTGTGSSMMSWKQVIYVLGASSMASVILTV